MSDGKTESTREIYRGRVVHLVVQQVRLPNGRSTELEIVHHPGAAAVVPVDDQRRVILVRQYRHAAGGWLLEIPAGKLDPGEAPEACAEREVEEEVGVKPGRLEPLGWIYTTPGFTDERIWLYLAEDLRPGRQQLCPHEDLSVERLPLEEACLRALNGELRDAKTVCALLRARARLAVGS